MDVTLTTVILGVLILWQSHSCLTEPQSCTDPCHCFVSNGSVFNLEPLASIDNEPRFNQSYQNLSFVSYNPCKTFNGLDDCNNAAACLLEVSTTGHTSCQVIGIQENVKWTLDLEKIITYTFGTQSFNVHLNCDRGIDNSTFEITSITPDTTNATLSSKCACLDGCPLKVDPSPEPEPESKLSTGSILVIIFFCLLVLYLVGGIIYNKVVHGATGIELIPNVELWRSFLRLVLDGLAFTCNCCGKRKSTPGYDNV